MRLSHPKLYPNEGFKAILSGDRKDYNIVDSNEGVFGLTFMMPTAGETLCFKLSTFKNYHNDSYFPPSI
jgi:hypothetical protein